jgi:microcompartment protein CcmL/EutN
MTTGAAPPGQEALAVVEVGSIARGYVVLDALAKKAPVTVRQARQVTPGKLVIVMTGDTASLLESFEAARETAKGELVDDVFLAMAHPALLPAVDGAAHPSAGEAFAVVEMHTVSSAVHAADIALKAADIALKRVRLAIGIGGKGVFTLTGALADVEAAVDAARAGVDPQKVVAMEIIAQPHDEIRGFLS